MRNKIFSSSFFSASNGNQPFEALKNFIRRKGSVHILSEISKLIYFTESFIHRFGSVGEWKKRKQRTIIGAFSPRWLTNDLNLTYGRRNFRKRCKRKNFSSSLVRTRKRFE